MIYRRQVVATNFYKFTNEGHQPNARRRLTAAQPEEYVVQFQMPGSPWVYRTGTGTGTLNPDLAQVFFSREEAQEIVQRTTRHPSSLNARISRRPRPWSAPQPNAGYYVWVLGADGLPLQTEGPHGPHDLQGAKTYARIAATKGRHDRAVSRGKDPETSSFQLVRVYRAGTGERAV